MRKSTTIFFVLIIIVLFLGCEEKIELPEYTMYNTDEYIEDSELCGAYRVIINRDATPDVLKAVARKTAAEDDYYRHTIWFYSSVKDIEEFGGYTVAQATEIDKNRFIIDYPDQDIIEYSKSINGE